MSELLKATRAEHLARSFGYLTVNEVGLLAKYAQLAPENATVVNIGAGVGTTAMAVADVRPDLLPTLYTIDNTLMATGHGLVNEQNAFLEHGFPAYPVQILADAHEARVKHWADNKPIDLLLVDDGHLEHEITRDITDWVPLVKKGGIILFHDYGKDVWKDVKLVVDKMMTAHKQLEVVDYLAAYEKQ